MERVNILLITTDQQHYSALGVHTPGLQTPVLDKLAADGTIFERAYCPNPTCSPTRASLITGLYPSQHGCWAIGVKLPEDVPTLGDIFQSNDYRSILIGKAHFQPLASEPGSESLECPPTLWNLDFWQGFHGPWYGFNHIETARMHANEAWAGQHYALWLEENGLAEWRKYFAVHPANPEDKYYGYYAKDAYTWELPDRFHPSRWVGERTVENIEQCVADEKPFFLWASFFDPHPPYIVPEPWAGMYDPAEMPVGHHTPGEFDDMPPHFSKTQEANPDFSAYAEPGGKALHGFHSHLHNKEEIQRSMASYFGMISLIDEEIGRILAALDCLGVADNTVVVFTSDHGHFIGHHGLIAKGAFHYEDLLRVPMIVRYPGIVPAGQRCDALQSLLDLPQTLLSAAGIKSPAYMQGVDQLDVWRGEQSTARDDVLVENRHNPTSVHLRTLITKRYKITVYRDGLYGELFDLDEDPTEIHNRWADPDFAQTKSDLLHRFVQAEIARESTRMPRVANA